MNQKLVLLLPAYNEELTIRQTILEYARVLDASVEFVIINNNSSDQTKTIAETALQEIVQKGRVLFEARQGKGNALRYALQKVEADIYIMTDADQTYPASNLPQLLEPIIKGDADMTVGDRLTLGHYQKENKRNFHGFGNNFVRNIINLIFGSDLKDIMSGFRVFSRRFIKNYPILVEGFQIETDMTLHALDKRFIIKEIPITFVDRPSGSFSKLKTFSDGFRVLVTIFNIFRHYKPVAFFSIISLIFFTLGIAVGLPSILDFYRYHYVYHLPSAVLAASLEIIALISFVVGIILDTLAHHNKQLFELRLLDDHSDTVET